MAFSSGYSGSSDYGSSYTVVYESEYRENHYLQKCKIYDVRPSYSIMQNELVMHSEEVQVARLRYQQDQFYYQQGVYTVVTNITGGPIYAGQIYKLEPDAKKSESKKDNKNAKHIRHQYLRNRIKERINAKSH